MSKKHAKNCQLSILLKIIKSRPLEEERPAKVLLVIITEGLDNTSQEFSKEHVKGIITIQLKNSYRKYSD